MRDVSPVLSYKALLEVFEPAEITLITSKKPKNARWAPPIAVAKRRSAPVPV